MVRFIEIIRVRRLSSGGDISGVTSHVILTGLLMAS